MELHSDLREEVLNRLKRIEGQVRGLQRLVEQGADCAKVASQVKAARTALEVAGKLILACHVAAALANNTLTEREAIDLIVKY